MIKTKTKEYKRVICALLFVLVVVEAAAILWMGVCDLNEHMPSIQESDSMWVGFNVSGNIRVVVPDTNCGEVPDEAWEEARRLLSKCSELKDLKFETVSHLLIESENNLTKGTNTDANRYAVVVSGIVTGDNTEEAKEHFWEDVCSGVGGEWCISKIDL